MGIVLLFVAVVFAFVLSFMALVHLIVGAFRWKGKFKYVDSAFFNGARAIDIFGNVAYGTLLNDLFIKKGGYHYGQGSETISSATGKNWVTDKLTFLGKGLVGTLNLIDTDHCWKYIEGDKDVYHMIGHPGKVKWYYTAGFLIVSAHLIYALCRLYYWIFF